MPESVKIPKGWRFASIPSFVFEDERLGPCEKLVVAAVLYHSWNGGECWPSIPRIAKLSGFGTTKVREAIIYLQRPDIGYLKRTDRKGRSCVFEFLDNPSAGRRGKNVTPPPRVGDPSAGRTPTPTCGEGDPSAGRRRTRHTEREEVNEIKEQEKDTNPPPLLVLTPPPEKTDPHGDFIDWWVKCWEVANKGKKYPFSSGRDGVAVRELLKLYGFDELKALAECAFNAPTSRETWWKANATGTLGSLRSVVGHVIQYQAKNKKADTLDITKSLRVVPDWGKV